ncbi:response regulator transcription factor [Streptomyces sp. 135]|uniref:response regulator transcription factor n=1 Tax=Streptomyces sp. 135 TaxID=2838850 RepID=UPI001CBEB06B|nr:response regulator transcription factor [Streptomyces sp. 135]
MTEPAKIGVFIVDDHEVVRQGLRGLLSLADDLEVVGEAGTVAEALLEVPSARPDVAVLDVRLPDGSGVEVCRRIRAEGDGVSCLMLTSFDDDEAFVASVEAGASGYALKSIPGGELVSAIRLLARGRTLFDPVVMERVRRARREKQADPLGELTDLQRRILAMISEGMTNRAISQRLNLTETATKNHVSRLLYKLGLQRRAQAAALAARLQARER